MKFYINSNLKANNLYDANDDGIIVTDSSQATFDGDPGVPSKNIILTSPPLLRISASTTRRPVIMLPLT